MITSQNSLKKPICRSSQKESLRNGISIKDLFFITLLWGTVSIFFSIFFKLSRRLTLATCTGERLFLGLLSTVLTVRTHFGLFAENSLVGVSRVS